MLKSLARSTELNFLSQLIVTASAFVISVAVARRLGPEAAGIFGYCTWLLGVVTALVILGGPNAITRFVAAHEDTSTADQIAGRALRLGLWVGMGSTVVLAILVRAGVPFAAPRPLLWIVVATVPWAVWNTLLLAILTGRRRFDRILLLQLLQAPLGVSAILLCLWRGTSVFGVLLALGAVACFATGCGLSAVRDLVAWRAPPLDTALRQQVRGALLALSGILFLDLVVWQRSEVFLLSLWSTAPQIAFYSIAYALSLRAAMLLPGAIAGVLLPQIAVLYAGRGRLQDVSPTYQRAVRYLALVSLPLGGAGVVLARPAVALAYGDGYEPMVPVLQVLVAAGTIGAIAAAASSLLYGIGRQNFILVALIGLAVLNLALDFVMIPRYAALGAAIAKGVAQGLGSAAGVLYVSRALGIAFPWRDVGRIALAVAGAMAVTAVLLPHAPASPSLGLALCTSVFAACFALGLKLLRVMNRDDRALWHRFRTGWLGR